MTFCKQSINDLSRRGQNKSCFNKGSFTTHFYFLIHGACQQTFFISSFQMLSFLYQFMRIPTNMSVKIQEYF